MLELSIIQKIIVWSIPVIFAITVHEVAHGWVANKLGDPTARMMGRLTLNPIKHIDPIGTLLIPGLLIILPHVNFIFGWAKPVPVAFQNLSHPRRDMALVASAGPIANFLMAIFWALVIKINLIIGVSSTTPINEQQGIAIIFIQMGIAGVLINAVLMILNLLPIPPLDGSRVVTSLLPTKAAYYYNKLERIGLILLIILLLSGVLAFLLQPAMIFFLQFLVNLFDLGAIRRII